MEVESRFCWHLYLPVVLVLFVCACGSPPPVQYPLESCTKGSPREPLRSVAFVANDTAVLANDSYTIKRWNLATGKCEGELGHRGNFVDVAPNGNQLVHVRNPFGLLHLDTLQVATRLPLPECVARNLEHNACFDSLDSSSSRAVFSQNGKRMAIATFTSPTFVPEEVESHLYLYDLETRQIVADVAAVSSVLAFSRNGGTLFYTPVGGNPIRAYDIDTATHRTVLDLEAKGMGTLEALGVLFDETLLFISSENDWIFTLDDTSTVDYTGINGNALRVSPDGKKVLVREGTRLTVFTVDPSRSLTFLMQIDDRQKDLSEGAIDLVAAFSADSRKLVVGHGTDAYVYPVLEAALDLGDTLEPTIAFDMAGSFPENIYHKEGDFYDPIEAESDGEIASTPSTPPSADTSAAGSEPAASDEPEERPYEQDLGTWQCLFRYGNSTRRVSTGVERKGTRLHMFASWGERDPDGFRDYYLTYDVDEDGRNGEGEWNNGVLQGDAVLLGCERP